MENKQFPGFVMESNQYVYHSYGTNQKIPVIVFAGKRKQCMKCRCRLVTLRYYTINKKQLNGRKCPLCGNNYFTYNIYVKHENCFLAVNNIDEIKKSDLKKGIKAKSNSFKQRSRYNISSFHVNSENFNRTPLPESKDHIYLKCELMNLSTRKTEIVLIGNYRMDDILPNRKIVSESSGMGYECLYAVANDLSKFTIRDVEYRIISYARYDIEHVNTYIDKNAKIKPESLVTDSFSESQTVSSEKTYSNQYIYVYYKFTNTCIRNKHSIQSLTMRVPDIISKRIVSINVYFCTICNKYFINYEIIQELLKKNIHPALHYKIINSVDAGLKPVSELMLYGYNVREGNLTEGERHQILSWIIENQFMSKHDIIANIQSKVDYNGKKSGNEKACKKWQDDILYVSCYTQDNHREVAGDFSKNIKH